jgi:hypothetical protein
MLWLLGIPCKLGFKRTDLGALQLTGLRIEVEMEEQGEGEGGGRKYRAGMERLFELEVGVVRCWAWYLVRR